MICHLCCLKLGSSIDAALAFLCKYISCISQYCCCIYISQFKLSDREHISVRNCEIKEDDYTVADRYAMYFNHYLLFFEV